METRHAQGVAFPVSTRRTTIASEGPDRITNDNQSRTQAEAQRFRLHGRASSGLEAAVGEVAEHSGEDAIVERVRSAHRFDRRGPVLRLVEPAPHAGDAAAAIAEHVAAAVGAQRFARAFCGQVRFVVQGKAVEVRTGGRAAAGLIERRFGHAINDAVGQVLGPDAEVHFVVETGPSGPQAEAKAGGTRDSASAAVTARRDAGSRPVPREAARGRTYRLEDFVVGESNRLAYNAAVHMADGDLGVSHGAGTGAGAPLFIHGPCGVGKTHLLQGVASRFRERHPGAIVRVISGEAFLNEFVAAVRHGGGAGMTGQSRSVAGTGGIERFRRQYRRCDLLCIDDVHILASKQATQQELLHTFDQIAQSGARIALACDQHPRQMKSGEGGFSPALVSRFLSGMVAGVDVPDATVRERAVRVFAQRRGLNLEEAALRLLVERTQSHPGQPPISVRDLEGLLTRVEAVHRLGGQGAAAGPVGVLSVERALGLAGDHGAAGGAPAGPRRPIRAEQIISHTCLTLGVERSDLGASTRHKRVVLARAVITHLCRELTTMSFPEIARAIGRPSHSTVITAHQRLLKQIEADEVYGIGPGGEAMTTGGLVRQLVAAITRG